MKHTLVLTHSQQMALTYFLSDYMRMPKALEDSYDVLNSVKTTPSELLTLVMDAPVVYEEPKPEVRPAESQTTASPNDEVLILGTVDLGDSPHESQFVDLQEALAVPTPTDKAKATATKDSRDWGGDSSPHIVL